jgi:hypothetical protein
MIYVIDVGVPFTEDEDWFRHDADLELIAEKYGGKWVSSGCGFGIRDIQFELHNKCDALLAVNAMQFALPAGWMAHNGYIGFDWQPKNFSVFLIHARDFGELRRHLIETFVPWSKSAKQIRAWKKDHQ